jgi:hypothetical protein
MNTIGHEFALQGQDSADKAADKLRSGIRIARQSATTIGDWLSHNVGRSRVHGEAGLGKHARTHPNIINLVGMIGFFTLMLFVGFCSDRLMW